MNSTVSSVRRSLALRARSFARLSMFAFRKNIRFLAIDMDRMTLKDPATIRSLSQKVAEGLIAGHFERLPYMCFSMDKIQDAVELMKSGQHIGKVLLSNLVEDGPGKGPLTIESNAVVRCDGDTYHLVLGGAGGIGAYLIITRSHARTLARSHAHTLIRSHARTLTRSHARQVRRWSAGCSGRARGSLSSP